MTTGKILTPFSTSVAHGFVDLTDVAIVARKVILDPQTHNLAQYELVGQNVTYEEVARIIGRLSRRDVSCELLSPTEFVGQLQAIGEVQSEFAEDSLIRMLVYYDRWYASL